MVEKRTGNKPQSGEVAPRASRRTFSREYKERIVRLAAEAAKHGGVGALLRREGIYSSSLASWRHEFESGGALAPKRRGPKPRLSAEEKRVHRLERENERLRRKLEIAQGLLDLQKKTLAMLESLDAEEGSE
jgi:transposase